ncbi:MAG: hypothetical protein WC880_01330 [Candidatus Paceibacterota bacterium]
MFNKIEKAVREFLRPKGGATGFMNSTARGHVEKHTRPGAPFDGD